MMNLATETRIFARLSPAIINLALLVCTVTFNLNPSSAQVPQFTQASDVPLKDQIADHERKLAASSAKFQPKERVTELDTLASLYRRAGNMPKALDYCAQAMIIDQHWGSKKGMAITQEIAGRIYSDMGQEKRALDLFNQALPVWRESGDLSGQATVLSLVGRAYSNLAQEDKALDAFNQALPLFHQLGNQIGEAGVLDGLGKVYSDMSQGAKSLDYLNQALALWRSTGERAGEALSLVNAGRTYSDLGQKQKSLEAYNQSLPIWREIGNQQGEASALNYLGRVYSDLGQKQTALDYYNQALPVWRASGNRNGEALDLNDIGRAHADLSQSDQALDFYNQALVVWRQVGNRRGEAMTMSNLSRTYLDIGQSSKGLEIAQASLPVWRQAQETRGEASALANIGRAYEQLGQPQTALPNMLAALAIAKSVGDPDMQGAIDTAMMIGLQKANRPDVAIYFGLEAVNSYQQIRRNIAGLDKDLQAGFTQSRASTYRILAELLVQAGRLGEAEQVLDLLKEQELKDIVRGASPDAAARMQPLKLSAAQLKVQAWFDGQQQRIAALTETSLQLSELQAKAARTAAEDAQMKSLAGNLQQGIVAILTDFNNEAAADLEQKAATGNTSQQSADGAPPSFLQSSLAKLGPRVLGIRILLGENHAYALVVTATTRKKFELNATPAQLRAKAFEVLETLAARNADPKPALGQLYTMVVAPLESELTSLESQSSAQPGVPTLLWSLDDALRYLPMAALYDGHRYMLERFNNVLFTPESYGHMADAPLKAGSAPDVLAMGLSKSYRGLPALPGVMPELDSVVHDPSVPDSHGPMEGKLLPNEQFTLAALKTQLGGGKSFSVVHIASHFVEETGGGSEPFLMLGGGDQGDPNGFQWSLSEMESSPVAFQGTRLLTLSACSTAKDYKTRDGTEMDSLGMIAQQKDAEAVLATLWDVNDASTSRLMSDFYSRWLKNPAAGKAEALRQAQLALLKGPSLAPGGRSQRGFEVETQASAAPQATYAHPFYWAPFVLIGNYQ